MKKLLLSLACVMSASCLVSPVALAKNYPEKPVVMSVAYSPGGGNDTVARLIAKHIEPYLGARMIVENNPGAGGQVGFTRLAKSKADGYTIGLLSSPSIFMIELSREGVEYTLDDFQPIAKIQADPVLLVVSSKSKIADLNAFIQSAKQAPGRFNIGGDGPQSNIHLQSAALEKSLGLDLNFISYAGSGPAATGLLGNEVQAALITASSALQFVNSGRMNALAIISPERHPSFPNVPTAKELTGVNVPDVGTAMRGVAAPKSIPQESLVVLQEAFQKLLQDKEFQEAAQKMGVVLTFENAENFQKELHNARAEAKDFIGLMK